MPILLERSNGSRLETQIGLEILNRRWKWIRRKRKFFWFELRGEPLFWFCLNNWETKTPVRARVSRCPRLFSAICGPSAAYPLGHSVFFTEKGHFFCFLDLIPCLSCCLPSLKLKSKVNQTIQVKFGFSEKATKFEKIFIVLLTRASCSVRATEIEIIEGFIFKLQNINCPV